MIPIKISFSGFMSYKEPQNLALNNLTAACVSGANGVGKSSILEAITWSLWGKTRSFSDDDLIYQGQQNMWVEIEFEVEGQLYKVARKRSLKGRGSSELNLFQVKGGDLVNQTEDSIKATQKKIINLLRMPYEIFVNSAYLRQGQADEFTKKTPSERKEILGEILGVNLYENISAVARDKFRQAESEASFLVVREEELKEVVSGEPEVKKQFLSARSVLEKSKKELHDKERELQKKLNIREKYQSQTIKLESIKEKYTEVGQDINQLIYDNDLALQEILKLKEIVKRREKIQKKYRELKKLRIEDDRLNQLNQKLMELREQKHALVQQQQEQKHKQAIFQQQQLVENQTKIKAITERIRLLKSSKKCPTCEQMIPSQKSKALILAQEKMINQLKEKSLLAPADLSVFEKQIGTIDNKMNKLGNLREMQAKIKSQIVDAENAEEEYQKLVRASVEISEKKKVILANKNKIITAKKRLQELAARGKSLKQVLAKIAPKLTIIALLENKVGALKNQLLEIQGSFFEKQAAFKQILEAKEELAKNSQKLKKAQENILLYKDISLAFGKKGIQAMIIAASIPEIQDSANEILAKMTDGKMRIVFETTRQKKVDKEIIETLEIKILDILGSRPYEMFSGGEAFRINFAIRIALSKLLAKRAGARLRFLAIDEGFGTQDADGRMHLVEAIRGIKSDFEKILIITHIQEIKDMFDEKIEVTKDENGSHLAVVSG